MTKELFIKYMGRFIFEREGNEDWMDEVNAVFHGGWEAIYEHSYIELFVDFMTDLMEDTEGWIRYFIFEKDCNWFDVWFQNDEGETTEVDLVVHIDSLDKLWRLITDDLFEDIVNAEFGEG